MPLRDQLNLLDRETEVVPGIQAIAAAGHTTGHLALAIASGGEELLYVSDAALHPIHLEHPDWYPTWDLEPEWALATRRRLFDRAADHALVLAFHFPPFPSLGQVSRRGRGWRWQSSCGTRRWLTHANLSVSPDGVAWDTRVRLGVRLLRHPLSGPR